MDAKKVMNGTRGLVVCSYPPRNLNRFLGCDDNPPNRAVISKLLSLWQTTRPELLAEPVRLYARPALAISHGDEVAGAVGAILYPAWRPVRGFNYANIAVLDGYLRVLSHRPFDEKINYSKGPYQLKRH